MIGILCEYDALEGLGHGCGHHMQGPSCLGAAVALKECAGEEPFTLVVYGTPAEETLGSKCDMIKNGCFHELDAAFMMHGSPTTCTDVKCLADQSFRVTFHGKRAHAALAPEQGRSAFDALLVAFNGIEFLREHVPDDVRMHYTVAKLRDRPMWFRQRLRENLQSALSPERRWRESASGSWILLRELPDCRCGL